MTEKNDKPFADDKNADQEEKRRNYHAAIEAAFKSKYDDEHSSIVTRGEVKIGEEPPILDLLVLKKDEALQLTDEIGSFFKENNVIEVKGVDDGISINDVFKALGYTDMYMAIGRNVDEIPWETVTVTVIQFQYPRAAFKRLQEMGCEIKERIKGCVWEASGPAINFPFQVVKATELGEEWAAICAIAPGASEDMILKLQEEFFLANDARKREHLAIVLKLSALNNGETMKRMKETGKMREEVREAVRYIFSEEIEAEKAKLEKELSAERQKTDQTIAEMERLKKENEAEVERVKNDKEAEIERLKKEKEAEMEKTVRNMLLEKFSLSTILKCTNATFEMVERIAKSLGMESVSQ